MGKIKIFYDGVSIEKYADLPYVEGFTTNTSFVYQANVDDYRQFIEEYCKKSKGLPCSFQIWSDSDYEIIRQAKEISSISDNIYVKIPIIKCNGDSNSDVIRQIIETGIKVNITAVHTMDQIDSAFSCLSGETPSIISIFAGGITDTGKNPIETIRYGVEKSNEFKNCEILWAGCQTNLNVKEAEECGCHIITIPDSIMNKLGRIGVDIREASVVKVNKFMEDGIAINGKF